MERRLAWILFGGAPGPGDTEFAGSKHAPPAPRAGATDAQWRHLGEQLRECRFDAPNARVHLIQARQNVVRIGLLWRRRHNGFAPHHYASWQVHAVEGDHLDLPRHLAATTAGLMVAQSR